MGGDLAVAFHLKGPECVKLTLEIFAYSFIGLLSFIFTWIPWRYHPETKYTLSEGFNQTVTDYILSSRSAGSPLLQFSYDIIFDLAILGVPFSTFMFLGLGTKFKNYCLFGLGWLTGYVPFSLARNSFGTSSMVTTALFILYTGPLFIPPLYFISSYFLPIYLRLWGTLCFGVIAVKAFTEVRTLVDDQIFATIIFLSVLREIVCPMCRLAARKASLQVLTEANTESSNVQRSRAWMFILPSNMIFAYLQRLFVADKSRNKTDLFLIIFLQGVIELSLRLTIRYRDTLIMRFFNCFLRKDTEGHSVRVVPLRARRLSKALSFDEISILRNEVGKESDIEFASKTFYSMTIISETLSEYCAIISIPLILFLFREKKVEYQFNYYNTLNEPFRDGEIEAQRLLLASVCQLCVEFIIDTISFYSESRSGYPLLLVWKGKPKEFWLHFIFACSFTSACVFGFVLLIGVPTGECDGQFLCACKSRSYNALENKWCEYINETDIGLN